MELLSNLKIYIQKNLIKDKDLKNKIMDGICNQRVNDKGVLNTTIRVKKSKKDNEVILHELVHYLLFFFGHDERHTKLFYEIFRYLKRKLL